jgi:hypothetical protein
MKENYTMYNPEVGKPFAVDCLLLFMTYIQSCPPHLHIVCPLHTINTSHPLSLIICFLYVYSLYYIIVHELESVSCAHDRVSVAAVW